MAFGRFDPLNGVNINETTKDTPLRETASFERENPPTAWTNQNLTKFSQDLGLQKWLLVNRWSQNFDIPMRFRMAACQMNDDRQIAAESRQIFKFCSLKLWSYTAPIFIYQNFTRYRGISVVINPHIQKTMLHFLWKCQNKMWKRSILTSAKGPKVNRLP